MAECLPLIDGASNAMWLHGSAVAPHRGSHRFPRLYRFRTPRGAQEGDARDHHILSSPEIQRA